MYRVHLRAQAERDLTDIWLYSAQEWGGDQADKYLDALHAGIGQLAQQPDLGKSYEHIRAGFHGYRVARHIIFYTVEASRITIFRVLHERMDTARHLPH